MQQEAYPVRFTVDYPDRPLDRLTTGFRIFVAIPIVIVAAVVVVVVVIVAWFAILFTGRYPRGMFDFVEGVIRWHNRVLAYALVLVTDRYPPFRLTQ